MTFYNTCHLSSKKKNVICHRGTKSGCHQLKLYMVFFEKIKYKLSTKEGKAYSKTKLIEIINYEIKNMNIDDPEIDEERRKAIIDYFDFNAKEPKQYNFSA